jgi:putative glutamine amidotransferase
VPTQTLEPQAGIVPLSWVMGQKYVRALTAAGGVPWVIPLIQGDEDTLRAIYERLDGLFLTGGVDVDPENYHEPRHRLCGRTDLPRDWAELALLRWAVADGKPVFGVCRGIQVLNVALGGTLYQDLHFQLPQGIKHDYFPTHGGYTRDLLVHDVTVAPNSRLGRILGGPAVSVNSMHHQGIKDLAGPLRATAHAPDGLVEGVEGANGQFLLGVQWHPEELTESSPPMWALFTAFVEAAAHFRA